MLVLIEIAGDRQTDRQADIVTECKRQNRGEIKIMQNQLLLIRNSLASPVAHDEETSLLCL